MDMNQAEIHRLFAQRLAGRYPDREVHNMSRAYYLDRIQGAAQPIADHLIERDVAALAQGAPLSYVTGVSWFYGLRLKVTRDTLIPRPETEELVHLIHSENKSKSRLSMLDIGTGSGCIPLALKSMHEGWKCSGLDVSASALGVARENARHCSLEVHFFVQDILASDPPNHANKERKYDLIVSNPPYIPPSERDRMDPSVLDHEPQTALFVEEENPLIFYKKIADYGIERLHPGGLLYFECNEYNSTQVVTLLGSLGYQNVRLEQDMQGKARFVRGQYRLQE